MNYTNRLSIELITKFLESAIFDMPTDSSNSILITSNQVRLNTRKAFEIARLLQESGSAQAKEVAKRLTNAAQVRDLGLQ